MKRFAFFLPLFFLACIIEVQAQEKSNYSLPPKNSYDIVKSVSDLISQSIEEQQSKLKPNKRKEYSTDFERLSALLPEKQQEIGRYIISIIIPVNDPRVEENDIAIFCKRTDVQKDQCTIAFLDGECVGVGTLKKGLFTNLPKNKYSLATLTFTLYSCDSRLLNMFSSPINFSLKNYYQLEYNRMRYVLSN
ncbi:MAG: hypothetical protein FWD60_04485 [Candidatus Azobacteroides sp.]|nr:hypothetical protein [Candidatus Azobacteroides sp.]